MGIALSSVSGGVLSSGAIKASLDKTGKVLSKIHTKALEKGSLFAQKGLEAVIESSYKVVDSLRAVGVQTKEGVESARHFLKRAFAKEHTSQENMTRTIQFVGKSGIDDYAKALDKLATSNVSLPKAGEEFLARNIRWSGLIKGEPFDQVELMKIGENYAVFHKNIDKVQPVAVTKKVWRGLRKLGMRRKKGTTGEVFTNRFDDIFKIHKGSTIKSGRYSMPGDSALYTSLSRKTAIKELKAGLRGKKITDQQVEKIFHIGSKNIELDKVLDLTEPSVLKQFKINGKSLTVDDIATELKRNPTAYQHTHIIGDVAKRKGFKAIKAPSATDRIDDGKNIIIFTEFK